MLDEGVMSPSDVAEQLDVPIGNVSYHVRQLANLGLIKLVREAPRRGAVEHYYTAVARPLITDKAWRDAPEIVREAMVGAALEEAASAVNAAAVAGGFNRDGAHVSRIPSPVDEQSWKEISKELEATMKRVRKIAEAGQARVKKSSHEDETHATVVMMFFEDAPVTAQPPQEKRTRRKAGAKRRATA
jgi:predicted transcriptional regulator